MTAPSETSLPSLMATSSDEVGGIGNNSIPLARDDDPKWKLKEAIHWGETVYRFFGDEELSLTIENFSSRVSRLRLDDLICWRCQLEMCPKTKRLHFQVYFQFAKKKKMAVRLEKLFVGRFRPARKPVKWKSYCTKAESQVLGPWGWDLGDPADFKIVETSDFVKSDVQKAREITKTVEYKIEKEIEKNYIKAEATSRVEAQLKKAMMAIDLSKLFPEGLSPQEPEVDALNFDAIYKKTMPQAPKKICGGVCQGTCGDPDCVEVLPVPEE